MSAHPILMDRCNSQSAHIYAVVIGRITSWPLLLGPTSRLSIWIIISFRRDGRCRSKRHPDQTNHHGTGDLSLGTIDSEERPWVQV